MLLTLHETVIPHMLHPALLADFLTYSLDQGGGALQVLGGLWFLGFRASTLSALLTCSLDSQCGGPG